MTDNMKATLIAALVALIPSLFVVGVSAGIMLNKMSTVENDVAEMKQQLDRGSLQSAIWAVLTEAANEIAANESKIGQLQTRMDAFDEISQPEEIRYWGYVKKQVPENADSIDSLERRLTRIEALLEQSEAD